MPESVEEFLARGGKINHIEENESSKDVDPSLKNCTCGCEGNWTDHSMRIGEKGEY